jgi:quercetin dioxygenase-like cupin family protein
MLILVLAALFCLDAQALDSSDNVKVTPLMKTTQSWDGKPLSYPSGQAEITGLIVEIAPGAETGWHLHPVPSFGLLLEGTLEVTLEDGRVKHLEKGDSLAEVVNTWHNGRSVGAVPARILVFYAGAVGQQLTVKKHRRTRRVDKRSASTAWEPINPR